MTDYVSDLKQWGQVGTVWQDGYSYTDGEPPVDAWDDYFNYHVIKDIKTLISLTNKRLDSSSDQRPVSPTDGEIYWDGTALEIYDAGDSTWRNVLIGPDGKYLPTAGGTMFGDIDYSGNDALNLGKATANDTTVEMRFSDGWTIADTSLTQTNVAWYSTTLGELRLGTDVVPAVFRGLVDLNTNDLVDGTTTVWDSSAGYIPQGRLQNQGVGVNLGPNLVGDTNVNLGQTLDISVKDGVFAPIGHLHDDRYVNETGDTMSGPLSFSSGSVFGAFSISVGAEAPMKVIHKNNDSNQDHRNIAIHGSRPDIHMLDSSATVGLGQQWNVYVEDHELRLVTDNEAFGLLLDGDTKSIRMRKNGNETVIAQ